MRNNIMSCGQLLEASPDRPERTPSIQESRRPSEGLTRANHKFEARQILQGDKGRLEALVRTHHQALFRLALLFVGDPSTAEEVVQETWVAVINGLDRFEGRASLKTWIFRILTFQAQKRAVREARTINLSSFEQHTSGGDVGRHKTQWASSPTSWGDDPEDRMLREDALHAIRESMGELPDSQREVLMLRDVEGWSSKEVCEALDLSSGNQRILLHRARVRMRRILDAHPALQ